MGFQIQDGTGSSRKASVNELNRLGVNSVINSRISDVSEREGKAFVIASGFINITTVGSFSAHTYISNTSDDDLFIEAIRVCGDGGSGATGMNSIQTRLIKNPSTGTFFATAVTAPGINPAKIGSSQEFEGSALVANTTGLTITDGSFMSNFTSHTPGHTIQVYSGAIILTKGTSLVIEVNPSVVGNICTEIQCWFEKPF